MFHSRTIQWIFGVYVRLMFVFISTIHWIAFSIMSWFVPKEARGKLWRMGVLLNNRILLRIAGIRLILHDVPDHLEHASIIVSNHPTFMDGFVYFSLFGPDVIPVTGPARYFAFPFSRVFKNMEAIHTARSPEEEEKFPDSYTRKSAIEKMIERLAEDYHVLIFPEGHVERTKRLYYIHTGAARVAIRSSRPVAVFGLTGADHIVGDGVRLSPGVVHVHFGGYVEPVKVSRAKPFRKAVKEMRENIEQRFVSLLPHTYVPDYIVHPQPQKTCAFIDIDNTLYRGTFAKDIIFHAMETGEIPKSRGWYILGLLGMDLARIISHEALMERAHKVVSGYHPTYLQKHGREYFNNKSVLRLFEPMVHQIKNHKEQGHHIVLVSEMPEFFAEIFAQHVGADASFGSILKTDKRALTGEVERLLHGHEKARVVQTYAKEHGIDLRRSYAYGDSYSTDVFMLKSVGNPVAVRPSRRLAQFARSQKWDVIA